MRRDAREAVYKLLFSNLFNDVYDEDFKQFIYNECNLKEEDEVFADNLVNAIESNYEEITNIIAENAKGYNIDRIYSTDKCALIIAVAEIKYFADIPNVVSIDEAIWLVRKYSTENSLSFVNGVLAKINNEV